MSDYYEGLTDRLVQGLDGRQLTWLSEAIGEPYKNVQRWLSGANKPPIEFLADYCEALPHISVRWLLLGEGTMAASNRSAKEAFADEVLKLSNEMLAEPTGG